MNATAKAQERKPLGYTLSALADAMMVPRRTIRGRADRGEIRTEQVVNTGSSRALLVVPYRVARGLIEAAQAARDTAPGLAP